MTSILVFNISGKSQNFVIDVNKPIKMITEQIVLEHKHINNIGSSEYKEYKLLYKGIELDDLKTLNDYKIVNNCSLQIITKTKPMSMPNRQMSESLPSMSIFESYMPSPLENNDLINTKLSKSNSPYNTSLIDIAIQNKNIEQQLNSMNNLLKLILTRIDNIENHLSIIQ